MIRRARINETAAIAAVWYLAGKAGYEYLPQFQALTPTEAVQVYSEVIAANNEVWVFVAEDEPVGFLAYANHYLDRLYVHPDHQARGIGAMLLSHAKALSPLWLTLHTHQQNKRARKLYADHGFVELAYGLSPAPELVPDVKCGWSTSLPHGMSVREAMPEDLSMVQQIHELSMRVHIERQHGVWDVAFQRAKFEDPESIAGHLLVLDDQEIVGCISVLEQESMLILDRLWLHPRIQNKGVGAAILHRLKSGCRVRELTLQLDVLTESRAVEFYQREGFVILSKHDALFRMTYTP